MGDVKDLKDKEAITKLKHLAENARICMFHTMLDKKPNSTRPMSVQKVDEDGDLWFFSPKSSTKNEEITLDNLVQLSFANNSSSEYLTVFGSAEILRDQQIIDELWNGFAKTWFNEGKTDPELTLIRVSPIESYYWDTKTSKMIQLIKIGIGAIAGKPFDDGVQGKIKINS